MDKTLLKDNNNNNNNNLIPQQPKGIKRKREESAVVVVSTTTIEKKENLENKEKITTTIKDEFQKVRDEFITFLKTHLPEDRLNTPWFDNIVHIDTEVFKALIITWVVPSSWKLGLMGYVISKMLKMAQVKPCELGKSPEKHKKILLDFKNYLIKFCNLVSSS